MLAFYIFHGLSPSRRHKTCIISLWETPDYFTCQRESCRLERVKEYFRKVLTVGREDYQDLTTY